MFIPRDLLGPPEDIAVTSATRRGKYLEAVYRFVCVGLIVSLLERSTCCVCAWSMYRCSYCPTVESNPAPMSSPSTYITQTFGKRHEDKRLYLASFERDNVDRLDLASFERDSIDGGARFLKSVMRRLHTLVKEKRCEDAALTRRSP